MKTKAKKYPPRKPTVVFLAGVGVGAVATLLLASRTGRANRSRLPHAADHHGPDLSKPAGRMRDELGATANKSAYQPETLAPGTAPDGGLHLKSEWPTIKNKLRQEYPNITDEDLTYVAGQGQELVSRLERRLGKSQVTIVTLLNAL